MLVEIVTFITAFSFANSQSFFPNPGRFSVTIEEIVPSAKEIRNVKVYYDLEKQVIHLDRGSVHEFITVNGNGDAIETICPPTIPSLPLSSFLKTAFRYTGPFNLRTQLKGHLKVQNIFQLTGSIGNYFLDGSENIRGGVSTDRYVLTKDNITITWYILNSPWSQMSSLSSENGMKISDFFFDNKLPLRLELTDSKGVLVIYNFYDIFVPTLKQEIDEFILKLNPAVCDRLK